MNKDGARFTTEAYDGKKDATMGAQDHCAPLSVNTVPF